MSEKLQLQVCIYELNYGYNPKMEGYTNLSLDIPKFCAIRNLTRNQEVFNTMYQVIVR